MKKAIIAIAVLALVGVGAYFFMQSRSQPVTAPPPAGGPPPTAGPQTPPPPSEPQAPATSTVLGKSAGGRDIVAYHYGTGAKELLFVGGIHGGYSWNTVLVARELMKHLDANPSLVPSSVRVTVVPVLNPDGLNKVLGEKADAFAASDVKATNAVQVSGRFNANTVDLNRNFDCDWKSEGVWQSTKVSGGSAAFSEPESAAIRDYVSAHRPAAAVIYYSAAGGVFASNCHNGPSDETKALTLAYANASGYPAYNSYDFYEITGDMANWLAKSGIPATSVLLSTHTAVEWDKNRLGIEALLNSYK